MMDLSELRGELFISRSIINQSSDPRIGSGRDNSTGGTLSHTTSSGTNSNSASSLGSTFVPVLVFSAVCLIIFFVFRRKSPRIYAPRTISGIRDGHEVVPALPGGWFNWIVPFFKIDDTFILNNCSLDGFFFLRYLRVLATIAFAGCAISWPVLLVIDGTGGNGQVQLDLLTIGNVAYPIRFYAHVVIAYIFFGFILFMVCRECVYYVNMRQAYLLAPQHAHRLSARTVLFTCVPKRFLDEHRLRKLYGDSVKSVWIPTNTKDLERLVKERESTAERLEAAEIELVKKANLARKKAIGAETLPTSSKGIAPTLLSWPGRKRRTTNASRNSTTSTSSATSAATAAPSVSPSPSLSSSSLSSSSFGEMAAAPNSPLCTIPSRASGDPTSAAIKESFHEETVPIDRHGSVSEAASSPSAAETIVVPAPNPVADLAEKLHQSKHDEGMEGKNDDGKEGKASKDDNDDKDEDEDEDEEDEANYVHPYGFAPTLPDVRGSVAAQWLPAKSRPTHRPLSNFCRKVDTIRWTRTRLKSLNQTIARTRRRYRSGNGDPLSAVFIEFDTQAAAQVAFQVLSHHQPLHMSPRFIGIRPNDIIWSSLRMKWWERIIRRFAMMGAVSAGVIFWSIPSALVGVVSNIEFLSSKVFFLKWMADLPSAITGVISGLLPSLALSLLMAVVPAMLRGAARTAGVTSVPMVELFTQSAYFLFQVVQVFLVTTLTSAASAAITEILEDPLSIKDLLSSNLPKASNFYLSYITVQCLAGGASGLVHILDLFRHGILFKTIENPRRAFKTYHTLKRPHWGSVFPVYTNMGVIAISYACIAPLILVFAGLGMVCSHYVYRYNLLYYFDVDIDSKGLHYPRALMHLLVGLYMAEICLIGLFSLQSAIGPVVLMALFMIFTILVHMSLNDAVNPLLSSLPRTLALEDKDLARTDEDDRNEAADGPRSDNDGAGLAADYYDLEEGFGEEEAEDNLHDGPVAARGGVGIDGAGDLMNILRDWTTTAVKKSFKTGVKAIKTDARESRFGQYIPWLRPKKKGVTTDRDGNDEGEGAAKKRPNVFIRWLHPEVYEDYSFLRKMLSTDVPDVQYPDDYARRGYWPPEMWKPIPRLWIPRDEARVSRQEVAHSRLVVPAFDRGIWLNPNGRVVSDLDKAPFKEPRIMY